MPKLVNNSRLVSPRARFYLVIGTTALALLVLVYAVVFERDSATPFLQSHALPILVLATLTAILTGWLQARDPRMRAGLFFKSLGKGLMLFAAGAVLLFHPSVVFVLVFLLGYISSFIGSMQSRAARRLKMETQPPNEKPGRAPLMP